MTKNHNNISSLHSQIFVYFHIFLIDQTEYQWIKKKLICTKNEEPKNTQTLKCDQREITPMCIFQNRSSHFGNEQYINSMMRWTTFSITLF